MSAEETNLIGGEEGARLLAHPLPSLRWALYDRPGADEPFAICQQRAPLAWLNTELFDGTGELREIATFSDRLPVASPRE